MATTIGDVITNDTEMYNLVSALKIVRNQLSSITSGIDQLNTQISKLQDNIIQFTATNVTLKTNLGSRITLLADSGTSSVDIALDTQCVDYSASFKDNEISITNMTNLIAILQQSLTDTTQQQTDTSTQAVDLLAQISVRMDVLRGL